MKTTNQSTIILALAAVVTLPTLQNPAGAAPGDTGRSIWNKHDVSHSEQGNFGIAGGSASEGIERDFGSGLGEGGGGFSLSSGDCAPDWDDDGFLTSIDVAYYFNDYMGDLNNGTLIADFNTDEITNSSDAVQFINAWFIGCW